MTDNDGKKWAEAGSVLAVTKGDEFTKNERRGESL